MLRNQRPFLWLWHPWLTACKSGDVQLIFPFSVGVDSLTIPFIRCGVREMHTSFSLWPQPYFPSFSLKKTNKPIFKFSEKCFPSSWFLNAFKWKKRTENRLLFGWFASSLKLLFFCFRDSVIDSTFFQIVKQLAMTRMMPFKIAVFFFYFFLNVSYYWMQTRINLSWLMVFHSYSVPAEFMNFANNIHSPFFFLLLLVSQEF